MDTDHQMTVAILWIVGVILGMTIIYFFFRWLFAIDKRVKQNDEIIKLLKNLSKKDIE